MSQTFDIKDGIKSILANKTPILMDGAIGTVLYNRGIFINRCFEESNLTSPELVKDLHSSYLQAGSQMLSTNSWGANRYKLQQFNLDDKLYEINYQAAQLAKSIAKDRAFVAGSIGPLGIRMEPWGPTSFAEALSAFAEQITGLVDGGVDALMFETFSDITEIEQGIKAARQVAPHLPVFAHLVMDLEGKLPMGTPVEWAIKKLDEWNVDVVGLNCSVGPQPMMSVLPRIQSITNRPLSVMPNAGLPKLIDGRHIYMSTPDYMANFAKDFLLAGVQFIGGCCGTTPEHIRAMAASIRHRSAMLHAEHDHSHNIRTRVKELNIESIDSSKSEKVIHPIEFAKKSRWSKKIALGEHVTTVELLPPAGVSAKALIEKAKQLKTAGIDCINIPDGPRASARMSAILTAVMIEQQAGIETVLHYTCRDRNLLGMQSDMLGIHGIGLRNMLLVTGDPPKMGAYPDATGVFDVDAIGLTNMVYQLNQGKDLGGRTFGQPTALSIGVGVNPVAKDLDYEQKRLRYKVEAGAEWAITQPVFDVKSIYRLLEFMQKNDLVIPIIAGIWPLLSYRNAVFMNNEVPGVSIPQSIMDRMAESKDNPEDAKKIGVEIAIEMIEALGKDVQGIQVSAPFGRIDLALQTLGMS
ncbi:MAG: bifunctional homocysteine S-methyltransferase/methylenetetrahydrofolate reductase [Oligoflexales bacterium]|nr:bifunctional homocysteine S-methyltransferase/methylenetetrahydrofolate reductase [Oligoflexales bacterium]